jgi:hypothetical protein
MCDWFCDVLAWLPFSFLLFTNSEKDGMDGSFVLRLELSDGEVFIEVSD